MILVSPCHDSIRDLLPNVKRGKRGDLIKALWGKFGVRVKT